MRTIKFRGKRQSNNEWVFGNLNVGLENDYYILVYSETGYTKYTVNPDTIGQFTGMLDKHGKEIYDGDIVEVYDFTSVYASKYKGVVKMVDCTWVVEHELYNSLSHPRLSFDDFAKQKTEIIGNIYDNPELIKMKQQEISSRNELRKEEKCCGDCCYMVGEDCYGYEMCAYIFGEHVRCFDKCHNDHFVNKDDAERYLHVLTEHNKWRRDDNVPNSMPMQDPKEIGLAIDFACDYIKTFLEL